MRLVQLQPIHIWCNQPTCPNLLLFLVVRNNILYSFESRCFFLNYMKCSTIGKFLITICKNPIDVFLIHQLVKVCDVRHVAPSFFWWSPLCVFGRLLTSQSVFFNRKKSNNILRVLIYLQKCSQKPFRSPGGRCSWGAIVCLLQLEAHDRMRSASNAAERHARSQKQIPGPESRWWSLWSLGFLPLKWSVKGKWR